MIAALADEFRGCSRCRAAVRIIEATQNGSHASAHMAVWDETGTAMLF